MLGCRGWGARLGGAVGAIALAGFLAACSAQDPRARILEERARWEVSLRSWAQDDDGGLNASLVASGPVRSSLETLTVRVDYVDAAGEVFHRQWQVLDLSRVERGAPAEFLVHLDPAPSPPDGLAVSLVPRPTPGEASHIQELQGLR